jgi:hypothetical protein
MSPDLLRWVLAAALFAHGVGHVLFMPLLNGALRLATSGHSWLLTGALGDAGTRLVVSAVSAGALVAFVASAIALVFLNEGWRALALTGALLSTGAIVAAWDGLPTSSAVFALIFDGAVLVALLVAKWPSNDAIRLP